LVEDLNPKSKDFGFTGFEVICVYPRASAVKRFLN